jgi:hypothetical protein
MPIPFGRLNEDNKLRVTMTGMSGKKVACPRIRGGERLKRPESSFVKTFVKELTAEIERCATHTPVEVMIDTVVKASRKAGINSCIILKYFQFTDEEIEKYFNDLCEEQMVANFR